MSDPVQSPVQPPVKHAVRRGLPRVAGGSPWPPVDEVVLAPGTVPVAVREVTGGGSAGSGFAEVAVRHGLPRVAGGPPWPPVKSVDVATAYAAGQPELAKLSGPREPSQTALATSTTPTGDALTEVALRRGLPRTPGGELWPPATSAKVAPHPAEAAIAASAPVSAAALGAPGQPQRPERGSEAAPQTTPQSKPAAAAAAAASAPAGGTNLRRWKWPAIGVALLLVAVLLAKWFVRTETGADFIARYDGAQPLPDDAPIGLPAWLGWAHFFNMFLMALIVKTGWQMRREAKAPAYWAPKSNPRAKISLTQFTHLALDAAWIALGVIFYILLFATGQWVRIVPTSWETFPNAVSVGIQYLTLDWPLEDPWVHYNALQELTYFAVVFIAAPLAIASGWRMSPLWPKQWRWFPIKTARRIHFPVMVFFVAFVIVHVTLVLLTGMRANFNAMFAMTQDSTSWTGTLVFVVAAAVIAGAWFAVRPLVVAPMAGKVGTVSQR